MTDPDTPRDVKHSLRDVLATLAHDMRTVSMPAASLDWRSPLLVIRSAHMGRMRDFLATYTEMGSSAPLHVLSHERDETALRNLTTIPFVFHPYPRPGPYRLDDLTAELLQRFRAVGLGDLVYLDAGTVMDEVTRMAHGIPARRVITFLPDGAFAEAPAGALQALAGAAFGRLLDWYGARLSGPEH